MVRVVAPDWQATFAEAGCRFIVRDGLQPASRLSCDEAALPRIANLPEGTFVAGPGVKVNGHAPLLGGLKKLRHGDTLKVPTYSKDSVGTARSLLVNIYLDVEVYFSQLRPTYRCQFTGRGLASEVAVRCGRCGRLFCLRAWEGDLQRTCPVCCWQPRLTDRHGTA